MTATVITVFVKHGMHIDWMDLDLPTPTITKRYTAPFWSTNGEQPYKLSYTIDGFFGTRDSKRYLHDMASRIAYTLNGSYEVEQVETTAAGYKLSRFTHLDRPPSFNRQLELNAWDGSRNEIFHALRHKAYQMFRTNTLNLEALSVYGMTISNSSQHVKYLAPNIFKWVEDNYKGRQSTMTRSEAALNASSTKAKNMQERIFGMLRTDLFSFSSLSDAARKISVSRITFKKYLQMYRQLQQALESYNTALTPYVQLVYTGVEEVIKVAKSVKQWSVKEVYLVSVASAMLLEMHQRQYKQLQRGQYE